MKLRISDISPARKDPRARFRRAWYKLQTCVSHSFFFCVYCLHHTIPFLLFFVRAVCVRACQPRHPFTVKRMGFPTYVRSLRVVTHLRYFRTSVPYLLPPLRPAIFFFVSFLFKKPGVSNLCCSCDKLNAREREKKKTNPTEKKETTKQPTSWRAKIEIADIFKIEKKKSSMETTNNDIFWNSIRVIAMFQITKSMLNYTQDVMSVIWFSFQKCYLRFENTKFQNWTVV